MKITKLIVWQIVSLLLMIALMIFAINFQQMKIDYKKNFDYQECTVYLTNWQINKSLGNAFNSSK